ALLRMPVEVPAELANGPAFCAGMDPDEPRRTLGAECDNARGDAATLAALYAQSYTLPKPTVAPVDGPAAAGRGRLVTVCDLAIAASGAKFGYPEVRRGLVAAMVMPHLLRHVGERAARWLLLSGELIAAEEAHRLGLVNEVVAPDLLLPTADTWAGYL